MKHAANAKQKKRRMSDMLVSSNCFKNRMFSPAFTLIPPHHCLDSSAPAKSSSLCRASSPMAEDGYTTARFHFSKTQTSQARRTANLLHPLPPQLTSCRAATSPSLVHQGWPVTFPQVISSHVQRVILRDSRTSCGMKPCLLKSTRMKKPVRWKLA